jgi:thiol:disulfide interchange protein DsbD
MVLRAFLFLLLAAFAAPAQAQTVRTPNAETELVSARAAAAPDETVTLVLRQKKREGWHTYWINPGDSGEPPRLSWSLPSGYEAGALLFPAPRIERLGPITTYVHDDETLYPIALKVPDDARPGANAELALKATWLICAEICVPEEGAFRLSLPIRAEGRDDARGARLADAAIAALPQSATTLGFDFKAGDRISVGFPRADAPDNPLSAAIAANGLRNAQYFPYSQALIDHAGDQKITLRDGQILIDAPLSLSFIKNEAKGEGLLVAEINEGGRWTKRAFMFGNPPDAALLPTPVAQAWSGQAPLASAPPDVVASAGALDVLSYILAAFVGGLILNIMPCVFPVLSIKALSLAGGAHAGTARRHGLLFLAGVMSTFMALAVALLALRAAGSAAGWGFQLQEPALIGALALLFFAIGLNLIGAFDIGGSLQNVGGGLAEKGGDVGAFATGALAVVAATPCTAPFMAGALGWAATAPPAASLAVFAGLGLGFAAPFTLLAFAPGLQKLLPKPGAWMDRAKQFLAFPMFAAAVWLVWVLTVQTGAMGTLALLAVFVAFAFAVWAWRQGSVWRAIAGLVLIGVIAGAWTPMTTVASAADAGAPTKSASLEGEVWSPERVAELRAAGTPVFVNFTAAWCVSCKFNEGAALSRPGLRKFFSERGIVYLKGDWTARDDVIARELAAHGRSGVPLYLYYAPGADGPVILPQILTEDIVRNAVETAPQKGETT